MEKKNTRDLSSKEASRVANVRWNQYRENKTLEIAKKIIKTLDLPVDNETKAKTIARQIVDKKFRTQKKPQKK